MKKKDGKDEWRSIPSGGGWDQRAIRIGFVVVGIILFIAALGGMGVLPLNLLPI